MTSDAQKRANKKYDDLNTIQIKLKLNNKTDRDIIQHLRSVETKQGYIKNDMGAHMRSFFLWKNVVN